MKNLQKNQEGFSILAIILVIVAVTVAIGIWALSGTSNTQQNSSGSLDIKIMSIINTSSSIKSSYDSFVISGINPYTIVFKPNVPSTATEPNILDGSTGISVTQPDLSLIKAGVNSFWLYNSNGGNTTHRQIISFFGVTDVACKRINYTLFGVSTIYPVSLPIINYYNGATISNPMIGGTPGYPTTLPGGSKQGCFGNLSSPNDNIYYRTLNSQS